MAGIFATIGSALNTITTSVEAIDMVVSRSKSLVESGFDSVDLLIDTGMSDLRVDNIVARAKADVAMATAEAEATAIRAKLAPKSTKKVPATSTNK